jgi:hypothetical protein
VYSETNASWEADIQNNQAVLGADIGVGAPLNGSPSGEIYTLSVTFNISQDAAGNYADHTQFNLRGCGLGFFNSFPGGEGFAEFSGLVVDDNGYMSLDVNNSDTGPFVLATGFSATGANLLSYTVNTSTGTISDVLLNGDSVAITAPAGSFTPALTTFAGFYHNSSTGGINATFGDFTVSTVPEPATLGLLGAGTLGLLLIGRKRRMV